MKVENGILILETENCIRELDNPTFITMCDIFINDLHLKTNKDCLDGEMGFLCNLIEDAIRRLKKD